MRRSRSGDAPALEELLQRHLPAVRAFVRVRMSPLLRAHESTSDVVQSVCRELLAQQEGFDYRGEQTFRAWLFTAAYHKLLARERHLRAQKRDARRELGLDDTRNAHDLARCYSQVLSPSGVLIAEEQVRALERAFDTLPDDHREVISLSRFARLDRHQIAEVMGRTEAAIRNLLPRALVALAAALHREKQRDDGGSGG